MKLVIIACLFVVMQIGNLLFGIVFFWAIDIVLQDDESFPLFMLVILACGNALVVSTLGYEFHFGFIDRSTIAKLTLTAIVTVVTEDMLFRIFVTPGQSLLETSTLGAGLLVMTGLVLAIVRKSSKPKLVAPSNLRTNDTADE